LSWRISAADRRGIAILDDRLIRSPSAYDISLLEDLAIDDCKESELPKVLCIFSLLGLYEETDDISSLELS